MIYRRKLRANAILKTKEIPAHLKINKIIQIQLQ